MKCLQFQGLRMISRPLGFVLAVKSTVTDCLLNWHELISLFNCAHMVSLARLLSLFDVLSGRAVTDGALAAWKHECSPPSSRCKAWLQPRGGRIITQTPLNCSVQCQYRGGFVLATLLCQGLGCNGLVFMATFSLLNVKYGVCRALRRDPGVEMSYAH